MWKVRGIPCTGALWNLNKTNGRELYSATEEMKYMEMFLINIMNTRQNPNPDEKNIMDRTSDSFFKKRYRLSYGPKTHRSI